MIRKLVAFIVLLGLGLLTLHLVLGEESFGGRGTSLTSRPALKDAKADTDEGAQGIGNRPTDTGGGTGIAVPARGGIDSMGDVVLLKISGELDMPTLRVVPTPSGQVELMAYRLAARDSRMTTEDVVQLFDVVVDFFEVGGTPARPIAVDAGRLTATTAYAKVARDEKGRPSIEKDRDIDLRDVVLKTGPEAGLRNLELVVAQALVRNADDRIYIRTTRPAEPFVLTVAHGRPLRLAGHGLDAYLPASQGRGGDESAQVIVQSNSELDQLDLKRPWSLRARGALTYDENLATGEGLVRASDDVVVTGATGENSNQVFGDRLVATLKRTEEPRAGEGALWRTFRVVGQPARFVGKAETLTCDVLDIQMSQNGEPASVTAKGKPSATFVLQDRSTMVVEATERIHLFRVHPSIGRIYSAYGMPRFSLGSMAEQIVVFEGVTTVQGEDLQARAEGGLTLLRPERDSHTSVVEGRGPIEVKQRDTEGIQTTASTADGFLLVRETGRDRIRLGSGDPGSRVPYEIRRDDLTLTGSGAFGARREVSAENQDEDGQRLVLDLDSAAEDVTLKRGSGEQLTKVRRLHLDLVDQNIDEFTAEGSACEITVVSNQGPIEGTAVRIESDDTGTVRLFADHALTSSRAHIASSKGETISGRTLTIRPGLSGRHWLHAADKAHLVLSGQAGPRAAPVELSAEQIHLLPYLLPPVELDAAAWFAPRSLRRLLPLAGSHLRGRVLHAEDRVHIQQQGTERTSDTARYEAIGDDLWLCIDGGGIGLLTGAPAKLTQTTTDNRTNEGYANSIQWMAPGAGRERLTLIPVDGVRPRFSLGDVALIGTRMAAGDRLELECDGAIVADGQRILLLGPVTGRTIDAQGNLRPDGLLFSGDGVVLERDRLTGALVRVTADRGASIRMDQMVASGQRLVLDLRRTTCTIFDKDGRGEIRMPGLSWTGRRGEVNYVTRELSTFGSRYSGGQQ